MFENEVINNARYKLDNFLSTEKIADFSLSRLGNGIKFLANEFKWPLIGTAAVGIPALAAVAWANHSVKTSPEYANPKYMNDDGSFLPSFTSVRQLQGNEDHKLLETLDDLAFKKYLKSKGFQSEWDDGYDVYGDFEKEFYDKPKNPVEKLWNYLDDNELPTLQEAKDITHVLSSYKPYYEGQKPMPKTASLKTADFLTRFGQDMGGAVDYALPVGVVGGLLGLVYNDLAGGNPDDASKSYFKGHNIGALLGGLYGATSTHLKISDKIKGLSDLIARRAATLSPDPSYALRTDKLKSALDALTKGGFIKGFETFI